MKWYFIVRKKLNYSITQKHITNYVNNCTHDMYRLKC